MKENNENEVVVLDSNKNEAKKEKTYKRKDLIITAIIAFLIGAILTAGGFTISRNIKGGKINRDFRPETFQGNIEDFKDKQDENGNFKGRMNRRDNTQNNQDIPNNDQQPNSTQQPNNSNSIPNAPNDNNQSSSSNKS